MRYTQEHLWLRTEDGDGDVVTVGITDHAAAQQGEVTFVGLPDAPRTVIADESIAVIETDEEATEIMAPLDGEIVEVNDALVDNPALVTDDPTDDGWLFRIAVADLADLDGFMDEATYLKLI